MSLCLPHLIIRFKLELFTIKIDNSETTSDEQARFFFFFKLSVHTVAVAKSYWEATWCCSISVANTVPKSSICYKFPAQGNTKQIRHIVFQGGTVESAQHELFLQPELHHHSGTWLTQSSEIGLVYFGSDAKM